MSNNPRFLSPEIPEPGGLLTLDEEQSSHCARVLRLKSRDWVSIVNGKGCLGEGVLLEPNPRKTLVEIKNSLRQERGSHVQVVFGITKPPSLELIFRKCTELGTATFQPLVTDHSIHLGSWNQERWQKIVVEACKQSQELWFPEILAPISFKEWLNQRASTRCLILCDERFRKNTKDTSFFSPADVLIGPEGGWSETERTLIDAHNPVLLGLGPNRLRAETACVVALALVKLSLSEI